MRLGAPSLLLTLTLFGCGSEPQSNLDKRKDGQQTQQRLCPKENYFAFKSSGTFRSWEMRFIPATGEFEYSENGMGPKTHSRLRFDTPLAARFTKLLTKVDWRSLTNNKEPDSVMVDDSRWHADICISTVIAEADGWTASCRSQSCDDLLIVVNAMHAMAPMVEFERQVLERSK